MNKIVDIEFGHVYMDNPDLEQSDKSIEILKQEIQNLKRDTTRLSVLMDDLKSNKKILIDHQKYKNKIIQVCEELKVKPISLDIEYESKFENFAKILIGKLDFKNKIETEYFRKEKKYVDFYVSEYLDYNSNIQKHKITLKSYELIPNHEEQTMYEKVINYSCAILTCCWYLYRLEYFKLKNYTGNDNQPLDDILDYCYENNFDPEYFNSTVNENITIVNILNSEFKNNEASVLYLLKKEFEIENQIKHIWY